MDIRLSATGLTQDDLLNRENGRLFKKHEELVQPISTG
jgi:hypothetical protein